MRRVADSRSHKANPSMLHATSCPSSWKSKAATHWLECLIGQERPVEYASPPARQRLAAVMHRLARYRSGRVELWLTPCVVTMPPPRSTALVVPTNERLCGTQFAHFPKGGPTPAATKIGERDYDRPRAERLLYQCESVDGIVTEFGGAAYESAIADLPVISGDADYPVRCKTGNAVRVPVAMDTRTALPVLQRTG